VIATGPAETVKFRLAESVLVTEQIQNKMKNQLEERMLAARSKLWNNIYR
jgi:hypothetical protein